MMMMKLKLKLMLFFLRSSQLDRNQILVIDSSNGRTEGRMDRLGLDLTFVIAWLMQISHRPVVHRHTHDRRRLSSRFFLKVSPLFLYK